MNKEQFTPGPWKIGDTSKQDYTHVLPEEDTISGRGWFSKSVYLRNSNGQVLGTIQAMTADGWLNSFTQWEANAKLIESAPDLYDALFELVEAIEMSSKSDYFILDNAKAALNKANGK